MNNQQYNKSIIISHRGNLNGPTNNLTENKPETIEHVLSLGFDCEVDVRMINGVLWLGHDRPEFLTDQSFLTQKGLWLHAKNIEVLEFFSTTQEFKNCNFFWHQDDHYTLCSQGEIWTYPGRPLVSNSIMVLPEQTVFNYQKSDIVQVKGVCTDWPFYYQKILNS